MALSRRETRELLDRDKRRRKSSSGGGAPGSPGADGAGLEIFVEDDTEVAAALITLAASGGGDMYMAEGTYTNPIVVTTDNVRIHGAANTIISPPAGYDGVKFDKVSGGSIDGVTVKDIVNTGAPESVGIMVRGGQDVWVTNNRIITSDDAGISIQYDPTAYFALSDADKKDYDLTYELDGHHHVVMGNYIEDVTEGSGIEMMRCNDTLVANNVVKDCSQHCIRVLGVNGCIIEGNQCHDGGVADQYYGGISVQGYGDAAPIGITKYVKDSLITNNRVNSYQAMTIFNGAENIRICDNILETNTPVTSYAIRTVFVTGHISPFSYDLKDVTINDNLLIGGRYGILLEQDTEGVEISRNTIIDYDYIGISVNGSDHTTTLSDIYIKDNKFKPTTDDTQDPKHGIYCIGSGADAYEFGNDHFSDASYTYSPETEASGGSITRLNYLADDSVGADLLAHTAVTPGSYTNTDLTVDQQGRITAAASGGGGEADKVGISISGGGGVITTGVKGEIEVPFACTINQATLLADQTGSIVIDVWKDTYANYPPTVADTITASAKPTISSADKSQDATLTGWTTAIAAGDILKFNVDSCSTITRCTLVLKVVRT